MFRAAQSIERFLVLIVLVVWSCLLKGQDHTAASATLQPSGEVLYQATYLFHLDDSSERIVPGAPYSADEIERHSSAEGGADEKWHSLRKIYRDSVGRMRIERSLSLGPGSPPGPKIIQITDPASGWNYVLEPQAKVAHRYRPQAQGVLPTERRANQAVEKIAGLHGHKVQQSTVQVSASEGPVTPPLVATLPTNAPPETTEDLGEKILDGLRIRGIRYKTIPASEDDTGYALSTEVWTSTELKIVILSHIHNPQASDHIVRLVHLTRTEPNPALFHAPSDYQIKDESADFLIGVNFEAVQN
jgi:hypothetical protein